MNIESSSGIAYYAYMKVIYGEDQKAIIGNKFTVLELDTFEIEHVGKIVSYAIIGSDDANISDMFNMEQLVQVHNTMMLEYRRKNWEYCRQAIENLRGKWHGEIDSFYDVLSERINSLADTELPPEWDGSIRKH